MKKIFTLVLVLSVLLCGCQHNNTDATDSSLTADSTVSSADKAELSLKEYADITLNAVKFPAMQEVTVQEMLDMMLDFSAYGIKDKFVYQQTMSVHLCEIIIVKTTDTNATLDALKDRRSALINQLAFYPEQQESADASVVGSKGDICYLIAHKDAKTAEKALLNAL